MRFLYILYDYLFQVSVKYLNSAIKKYQAQGVFLKAILNLRILLP